MSAADEAYRAAEAAIAEAKRTAVEELWFHTETFRALDRLPLDVAALQSLRGLNLSNTRVSDLSPLAGMTGMRDLSLSNTRVSDLSPLAGLTRLRTLRLDNTQVIDLSPLAGMLGLEALLLSKTQVSDVCPIAGMTGMKTLLLDNTQVNDLFPLAGMAGMRDLSLSNTRVSDLSPLAGLTGMRELLLDNTQVSDLSPLAGMWGLATLWLDNTQVRDLRPLRRLEEFALVHYYRGLTFGGIPATVDPRVAEIAVIRNTVERAAALFALLDAGWVPPVQEQMAFVPEEVPAPIKAELNGDSILVERPSSTGLNGERDARARAGWGALCELQADALVTLCRDNLPSLRRAIHAVGRALGNDYSAMNVIALGTHGRRIVEMSKTVDDALLEDAAGDLVAFAAAIELHLQLFPEWVAYLADTEAAAPEGPPLAASLPQLRVIVRVMEQAEDVDPALARKFGDLLEGAEDAETVDAPAKFGVLRSLSNILAPLARQALAGARKLGGDLSGEAYKTATKGVVVSGAGVGWDLIFNKGQVLLTLAQSYPSTLGWLTQVLRALGIS
jgi:hypothetical protein